MNISRALSRQIRMLFEAYRTARTNPRSPSDDVTEKHRKLNLCCIETDHAIFKGKQDNIGLSTRFSFFHEIEEISL